MMYVTRFDGNKCKHVGSRNIYSGGSRISGRGGLITIFTSEGGYGRGRAPSRNS